jgi:serine/threonine-protein kinase
MDTKRTQRLIEILDRARSLPAEQRAIFLESACGGDSGLHAEVESLLQYDATGEVQGPDVTLQSGAGDEQQAPEELLGRLADHRAPHSRYQVRGKLASGGMGDILRVFDEDLRRTLAMKVIRREPSQGSQDPPSASSGDARTVGRFVDEAQITGQLHHPGIVPVHELGLDEKGQLFFTMQLVKGQTFREVIDWVWKGHGGWNQTRALSVLLDVCDALAYAHSRGVIHRDLKPANIMVGKFGETYVMDWGVARVVSQPERQDLRLRPDTTSMPTVIQSEGLDAVQEEADSPLFTMDGFVVGTPSYMAPEQALGMVEKVGAASDVYAVGALLYHLLTNQPPYVPKGARLSARSIHAQVVQGPPKPVHELNKVVPGELLAICEKAMAREIEERYAGTQELAEDLRAYLENRVVRAYQSGAVAELRKWIARNRAIAASLGAAVLMALLASGIFFSQNRKLVQANEELAAARMDALQGEQEARRERQQAVAERENVLRLADARRLGDLQESSKELWPMHPNRVGAMEQWLAGAEELLGNLSAHRSALETLRSKGRAGQGASAAEDFVFASAEDAWWHDALSSLVGRLEELGDLSSPTSLVRDVTDRLDRARTLVQRSVLDQVEAWDEALFEISESERYHYLEIEPQIGLVPLGPCPDANLWEFWVLDSGARPERDADDRLVVSAESGIVLILLPEAAFWMGAQSTRPNEPNYDPGALPEESPVHQVSVEAFFMSKYELTQSQYLRLTGDNPSAFGAGHDMTRKDWQTHPVEQVDFEQSKAVLRRVGLVLPDEQQWEYAARGGTNTPWWPGERSSDLKTAANIADQHAVLALSSLQVFAEKWNDGFATHAPVGSLEPNSFGLHDVHGNIGEWTCVPFAPYAAENLQWWPYDSEQVTDTMVTRGGAWMSPAATARCAIRGFMVREIRHPGLGLRPARLLDP